MAEGFHSENSRVFHQDLFRPLGIGDESGALDLLAQLLPWLEFMETHTYNSSNPKVEAGGSKAKG